MSDKYNHAEPMLRHYKAPDITDPRFALPWNNATSSTAMPETFSLADLDRMREMLSAPPTAAQVEMRRRAEEAWARTVDAAMAGWDARPITRSNSAAVIKAGIATLGLDLVDPRGVLRRLPVGNASSFRRGQLVVLDGETFVVTDVGAGSLRVVSCSEAGRNARASWERGVVDSLDAQRVRDLAERDAIRAWMRADRTRDGERVLPLP